MNKIFISIVVALILVVGINKIADVVFYVEKPEKSVEEKISTSETEEVTQNEEKVENKSDENEKTDEEKGSKNLLERHQERVEEVNEEKSPDLEKKDSDPPLSMAALPVLIARLAASMVTLGRDS